MCSLGIRPDLNPEDRVVKRKLAKCLPCAYSELIRLDIPGSSGSKSSQPSTPRPSPPFVMKFSHDRPPVVKPTKGELQARVETLSRRSRSVKRKTQDSLKKSHSAWGKKFRSLALLLLQRPKIPWGGMLSIRWRLCPSQFGVLLRKALSLLLL